MDNNKEKIYRQLMWDYNISPEEVDKLVKGETQFAGHYDINSLFVKMLESFPWFTIVKLFEINTIARLLTEEVINKLRTPALRKTYFYVKKRLHEIVPTTG